MKTALEFGVDWYPEQWEPSIWQDDARRMAAYGFSCARIMEFAWSIVEPQPGHFDFGLFDKAIDVLATAGLKVIIGTPTATPPSWMAGQDVFRLSPSGQAHDFGARRNLCYNAPSYRQAARRISQAVADHFGADPWVMGFQIDNEVGHEGSDRCTCSHCRQAWQTWLEKTYTYPEAMNEAWGAVFWGASYTRFEQVPVPRLQPATGHNPGLLLDYDRFCSDAAADFVHEQTGILRAKAGRDQWITTNLFPPPLSNAIDMERLTKGMDFASWDNYPIWGDQDQALPWQFTALAHAYVRGLRGGAPFTVMEEMSGIQGHVCLGQLPPEKQVALWTVQAVARGANRIVFFRWRTAPYGQEQLCYGLLDTDGTETMRLRVLSAMISRAQKELGTVAGLPAKSPACLVYSKDDARVLREQYLSKGLFLKAAPFAQAGYDMEMAKWYAPYATLGVDADAIPVENLDMDAYKLIALPLYQMADPELVERLSQWVQAGGTLVLGYRAGARDLRNHSVREPLPGIFRELAGIRVPRFESLNNGKAGLRIGLIPAHGTVWADLIEPETARVVATWTDRKKFYRGTPAVTVNTCGSGKVWYIGTSPDPIAMLALYRRILCGAGLKPRYLGAAIEQIHRTDTKGHSRTILLNHSTHPKLVPGGWLESWGWRIS
jgi:beta-galactosidase